jgi:NitT/TauT family transport system ATP-binding protein
MDSFIAEPDVAYSADAATPVIRMLDVSYHHVRDGGAVPVLDHLTLEIRRDEILGIFGPNGCGKSSLLNVMTGLLRADAGAIELNSLPDIRMSYLAQDYAQTLLPWLRVKQNLLLPLRYRGLAREDAQAALAALLAFFDYPLDLEKDPYRLSGGQQQILALLRCLIQEPDVVLLDEPFSAINFHRMFSLRQKLGVWAKQRKISMVIVSHNLDDLAIACDRVVGVVGPPLSILTEVRISLPHPRRQRDLASREIIDAKARIYGSA